MLGSFPRSWIAAIGIIKFAAGLKYNKRQRVEKVEQRMHRRQVGQLMVTCREWDWKRYVGHKLDCEEEYLLSGLNYMYSSSRSSTRDWTDAHGRKKRKGKDIHLRPEMCSFDKLFFQRPWGSQSASFFHDLAIFFLFSFFILSKKTTEE